MSIATGTNRNNTKKSKIEELRSKYQSENTIYEKNMGYRNAQAFGQNKAQKNLKSLTYEINNSISECSIECREQ